MQNRTLLLLCSLVIIFFYLCDSQATDYFSTLTPACTVLPRVRKSWTDLTQAQQTTYVKTVVQMKALQGAWKAGSTGKSSLYNFFVTIHAESYNSYVWHGTSFFLPAHKWFMWNYESALIYVAYQKYSTIGIAQADACKLSVPYWDWTRDYDSNTNDNVCPFPSTSLLLDANDIGSKTVASRTKYVNDGYFDNLKDWTMVYAVQSSVTDYRLKRTFDCRNYPLTIGPLQAIQAISGYPNFGDFTSWLEGYPHGIPHMNIGMSMGGMGSPDDPIFFLHHSNVDRLYHVWVDCNEYENIPANAITTAHYTAQGYATNPYNSAQVYDLSVDATIPYSFGYSGGVVDSVIFPKSTWPSPRIMWPTITGGYKGFNLRYGPDYLVQTYGYMCTKSKTWSIVNYGSTKRAVEGGDEDTTTLDQDPQAKHAKDRWDAGISAGRPHHEVMRELAEEECRNSPKLQVTDDLLQWIKMNNLKIEQFDTLCHKVSESFSEGNSQTQSESRQLEDGSRAVPLWVIITASVGTALVLVAIVTLIILYFKKKNSPTVIDNSYVEMK